MSKQQTLEDCSKTLSSTVEILDKRRNDGTSFWRCDISNHTASLQSRATIGPPAKRHSNGVSLADLRWLATICLLGAYYEPSNGSNYFIFIGYLKTVGGEGVSSDPPP